MSEFRRVTTPALLRTEASLAESRNVNPLELLGQDPSQSIQQPKFIYYARSASDRIQATQPSTELQGSVPAVETPDRFAVRAANRVATLAEKFSGNMGNRRTTRETVSDTVETGLKVGREVGAAAVDSLFIMGGVVGHGYDKAKTSGTEKIGTFKSFLRAKAESAHKRKDELVANLRDRRDTAVDNIRERKNNLVTSFMDSKDKAVFIAKQKAEAARVQSVRAAKVGGKVVLIAGLAPVGVAALGVGAVGYGAYRGGKLAASKTSEVAKEAKDIASRKANLTHGQIVNLRARSNERVADATGVWKERKAAQAQKKTDQAQKAMLNEAYRINQVKNQQARAAALISAGRKVA